MLKTKIEDINWDEASVGEFKENDPQTPTWITPEYHARFALLSSEEQAALNDYFAQMVTRFEQDLLRSRDALSETEHAFARTEIAKYLGVTWFM